MTKETKVTLITGYIYNNIFALMIAEVLLHEQRYALFTSLFMYLFLISISLNKKTEC